MASSWFMIWAVLRPREAAVVNLGSNAAANTLPATTRARPRRVPQQPGSQEAGHEFVDLVGLARTAIDQPWTWAP
jgi:hypothetical protein